ncbi:hypothetical protein Tco_0110109 [Tanacetum coccineum]
MPTIITGRCLIMTVALQRDEATTAAVEPAQAYPSNVFSGVLQYRMYGVCIGILACRGLSLVSSPLHAMKSQSQIQSSAVVVSRDSPGKAFTALGWIFLIKDGIRLNVLASSHYRNVSKATSPG